MRTRLQSRIAVLLLVAGAGVTDAAPPDRAPVPPDEVQKKIEADVRGLYRAEYAKKFAADQRALAARLLQLGLDTTGDPAARYVLFREATDLAAKAADPALALKAVSHLAAEFRVDGPALTAAVLEKAAAAAAVPSAHRAVAATALVAVDEAVRADRYDEAVRLAGLAARAAARAKDDGLAKKAAAREKEVKEVAAGYELVKAADARLRTDPTDAGAARAVGRFRCLLKGDWDGGLPLLAQTGDGRLRDLARQDLGSPMKPDERMALADGYWDLAGAETGAAATQLRRRAGHVYRLALPDLGGLARERAGRRVEEVDPPGPWDHLELGGGEVVGDFVRVARESQVRTKEEFTGPVEMRVVARTPADDIRLFGPSGSCVIFNWGANPNELRLTRPDGRPTVLESGSLIRSPVKPLKPDTWYTLRWRLTATEFTVWVDDKVVFTEKGKYTLGAKAALMVGATSANTVDVKSVTVRSLK
ncbi:MAG: hypothetical protein JWO38_8337 [Gemmataceae bacterium]|nr:hypothetical protein [Gemmataceae bacterium]